MPERADEAVGVRESQRVLRLVVVYSVLLVFVIGAVSWLIWDKDKFNPIIMFVPVAIWEWSFAGGMAAVLYRLGSPRFGKPEGAQLYSWAISTPVVGLFLGATVYFVALAGARLVGASGTLQDATWLNVIAFFGAFRGDLTIRVLKRFFGSRLDEEAKKDQAG